MTQNYYKPQNLGTLAHTIAYACETQSGQLREFTEVKRLANTNCDYTDDSSHTI